MNWCRRRKQLQRSKEDTMRVHDFFELAKRVAIGKHDKRNHQLAAVGVRSDGAIVWSPNGPTPIPNGAVHAEQRCLNKMGYGAKAIYVARIRKIDGSFGLAKPCFRCMAHIIAKGVKRVYFTVNNHEHG